MPKNGKNSTPLKSLQDLVVKQGLDVAYVSDFKDIEYLTNFGSDPLERVSGLFVMPNQTPFLVVPALEVAVVKETGWPYPVYGYLDSQDPYAVITHQIKKLNPVPQKWGIEKTNLSVQRLDILKHYFKLASFNFDVKPFFTQLRLIKTPKEIEKLKLAGQTADLAFQIGFQALKAGKTEVEIAAEIEGTLKKQGVKNMSFPTLIQTGPHAADPHGETGLTKIQKNTLVLFDLGTENHSYMSDASRTVAVGNLSSKQKEVYAVVLKAQLAAQAAAKPGIKASELDAVARNIIEKAGYGQYFIHRLGHGIGLSEHEEPMIMPGNDQILQPGMAFSLEPGIYIPGEVGVRIEDAVYLTKNGHETLTHTTKQLQSF